MSEETLSKMHTGEHVFFKSLKTFVKDLELEKIDLDANESSLFVNSANITLDDIDKAEKLANQIISEGRVVKESFVSKDDAKAISDLRIKIDRIKEDKVRVIEVEGFDKSACSGEHVRNTKEIGNFVVIKINKVKQAKYEIRFKTNTTDDLYFSQSIVRKLRMLLNSEDLIKDVENLKQRCDSLKEKVREISKNIEVKPQVSQIANCKLLTEVYPGINKQDFVKKIVEETKDDCVVCFINEDEQKQIAIACGDKTNKDASQILKSLFSKFPGKGGGNKKLAQGSVEGDNSKIFSELKLFLGNTP